LTELENKYLGFGLDRTIATACKIYFDILNCLCMANECDRRMDRQKDKTTYSNSEI